MRCENLSNIEIPKVLWRRLAIGMDLGKVLPQAIEDELGMYGSCKVLRVIIRAGRPGGKEDKDGMFVVGSYSFGCIELFPCRKCAATFLTLTFLHELVHAWLHQYHESLFEEWEHCDLAEKFALHAFSILGGKRAARGCSDYKLNIRVAMKMIPEFNTLARSLTQSKRNDIKYWKPKNKVGITKRLQPTQNKFCASEP